MIIKDTDFTKTRMRALPLRYFLKICYLIIKEKTNIGIYLSLLMNHTEKPHFSLVFFTMLFSLHSQITQLLSWTSTKI